MARKFSWISVCVLFILLSSLAIRPARALACDQNLQAAVARETAWLQGEYARLGNATILPQHQPVFLAGNNGRIVIMVHGFISSPAALLPLAQAVNQAGFSVYLPLVYGFGSSYQIANQTRASQWRESVTRALDTVASCYREVSLLGHSLGASLLTELILTHPEISTRGDYRGLHLRSLTLLTPFFRPYYPGLKNLDDLLAQHTDHINYQTLAQRFTTDPGVALSVPVPPASERSEENELPLLAAREVLKYSDTFQTLEERLPYTDVPGFLILSEADRIVDSRFARNFVRRIFGQTVEKIYPSSQRIPHDLNPEKGSAEFHQLIISHL